MALDLVITMQTLVELKQWFCHYYPCHSKPVFSNGLGATQI